MRVSIFDTVRSNSFPGLPEKMIPLYAASSSKVIASLRISYTTDTNVASVKTMIKTLAEVCAVNGSWTLCYLEQTTTRLILLLMSPGVFCQRESA